MTLATSTRRSATGLLNRLIIACNDGTRAQRSASLVVRGGECRARLEDSANRRVAFANELAELVRGLGGTPANHGTAFETVRAAVHWVDALLIGDNGGDAYRSCARIEARAEKLYERATHADLPGAASRIIAHHHAEIVADHAELRRLSMGG
jgi:uncharacterized protein (TIGR02284 family)